MEGRGGGSARISAARPQFHPFQPVRPRRFPDAWVPPANAANSTASRPPDSVICRRDTVDTKPALVTPSSSPSPPINTSNFQPRVTPMNPIFFKFDKSKERDLSYNLSPRSDKKNPSLGTGRIGYSIRSVRNEPPSPPSRESSSRNGILAPRYPL